MSQPCAADEQVVVNGHAIVGRLLRHYCERGSRGRSIAGSEEKPARPPRKVAGGNVLYLQERMVHATSYEGCRTEDLSGGSTNPSTKRPIVICVRGSPSNTSAHWPARPVTEISMQEGRTAVDAAGDTYATH
jgi:hypothetical protein